MLDLLLSRPNRRIPRILLLVLGACAPSSPAAADHPLPGPHRFDCALEEDGVVFVSWDELGIDAELHQALLYRNGSLIARLEPLATAYTDEGATAGIAIYRLDIVSRDAEPATEPIARRSCEVVIPGVICQVFGGVAQPPQLDITWFLPRPDASEVRVLRDEEIVATLPGDSVGYTEEPDGALHVYRVEASYGDEGIVVGSCEVDYEPPVIGGFQRGDCTGDGSHDISDPVCILRFLFLGGGLGCESAADVDDSGTIEISDPIYLLNYSFLGGPSPAEPFPDCGHDATPDELGCLEHAPCFNPPPP